MRKQRIYSWPAVVCLCSALIFVFMLAIGMTKGRTTESANKEASLQYTLTQTEQEALTIQKSINGIGSDSYIEATARATLNYVKQGEIHFQVENSELLENYTTKELQILADELAQPDR